MSSCHVLHVTKSTAGVGQYVRWVVQGLDRTRFRLTVVCLSEGGSELAAELRQIDGVRAIHFEMNRYQIDPIGDARVAYLLRRLILHERFDLIHAHASKPGFLARIAAIGTGIPVIYCPNCFSFHDRVPAYKAVCFAAIERMLARYLTAYIQCVCNDERELARRYRVGNDKQLVTIYTGIDPKLFDIPADRVAIRRQLGVPADAPLVIAVGRLTPQKAPLDLVHAAALIHTQAPHVHIVWVGSGPLEQEAHTLVEQLQLQHIFHFAGERRDVPQLLQAGDVFVLPSHWEGFSLSVLEAMAARLPVVTTQVTGATETVIDGQNGAIVPIGEPGTLGQALLRIVTSPIHIQQYGHASRQRIDQQFTRTSMITQIESLYEIARETRRQSNKM